MSSRFFRRVLTLFLLFVAGAILAIMWMAGGVQTARKMPTVVEHIQGHVRTGTSGLSIVSWNIAWGYGWGSEGSGAPRSRDHFEQRLTEIASVLKKIDADIVLLQEVDFDSTRSHGIDQARYLALKTGYPFIVRAESWRANWVPFPYWPIRNHFGRMHSGGAILSHYPLTNAEAVLFEKPAKNPFWYNLFYLFRYAQTARVVLPGRTVNLINTHLEAFDRPNREGQAERLVQIALIALKEGSLIIGGDFNSVPPEATIQGGYEDEPESRHDGDRTIVTVRAIDGLSDSLPSKTYLENESAFFTFPAHAPNRKLDFVFGSDDLRVVEARTIQEAGDASDHLPIFTRFKFD